ncbi:hypothetical protein ANCCAN_15967 [Ancylostoma caninum]|uniref:Neurotransmitter-gated ion-channel transmembrane domain-containing protein n=1 Tax=Ancylostoma caninum TaxID=29170 RepID=A0A368G4C0_ANCCA|nr:hypothetical protein ANCCAN_15967 [Ancylostoma caninum]
MHKNTNHIVKPTVQGIHPCSLERLDEEERESDMQADWKFTAMVIDRFSLFLFTILIGATTALVFLSTPRLFMASPVF